MPFDDDEADRLNAYLDAHVRHRRADPDGVSPDLIVVFDRINAMNERSAPDPALKAHLWKGMQATFPAPQTPAAAPVLTSRRVEAPMIPMLGAQKPPHARGPRRVVGSFMTAALVLIIVFGAYLFTRPSNGPGPGVAQIAALGTPASTAQMGACLGGQGAIFEYPKAELNVTLAQLQLIYPLAANMDHVQLQGWVIDGGASAGSSPSNQATSPGWRWISSSQGSIRRRSVVRRTLSTVAVWLSGDRDPLGFQLENL